MVVKRIEVVHWSLENDGLHPTLTEVRLEDAASATGLTAMRAELTIAALPGWKIGEELDMVLTPK